MAEYLHGAYGHLDESIVQQAVVSETVPVYFGTAPVGQVRGWEEAGLVNEPVKISSLADAKAKIGYSSDFASYTLCEAVAAHFDTDRAGVGPIYVVNVLDPSTHKKADETAKTVVFAKGRATVVSDSAIIDTVKVTSADGATTYVEGTDYTLSHGYGASGNTIVVMAIEGGAIADGEAKVTYTEMDPTKVTVDDVVGMATDDGLYTGIEVVRLMYQDLFVVPNLLAAPGWSHIPAVYNALVSASSEINGHWDAMVVADLPLVDEDAKAVDTIAKAIEWKADKGYTSERAVVCWPMATDAKGRRFHVSTLFVAGSQRVDQDNGGIPYETPSNKTTDVTRQFFGDNSRNRGFDQQTANQLNEHGITTVIGWAGEWVLWGSHTAAYEFGNPSVDPRAIFAPSMRMLMHITNSFQLEWSPQIDEAMTRALKDRIINREQEKLDGYVTVGALIGQPRIYFLETENPTTNLMNGDFVWSLQATPTPPLKSATAYVSYTDDGFKAYFEGVE